MAWPTTCSGTRVHRAADVSTRGFEGVPPEFVVSQLATLAGVEALREVAAANPCEDDPESIQVRGWVPAHGEAGTPVAWYHSRGC